MVLFAYFDESGKPDSSNFVCIAGYASDDDGWNKFCDAWPKLLNKHRISAIHMKDLMALRGEYEKLGWDLAKRDQVLAECINILNHHAIAGFGVGVDAKHWRGLDKAARDYLGNPLMICMERVLRLTINMFHRPSEGYEPAIPITFDDDREYAMAYYRRWSELREKRPTLRRICASIGFADDTIYWPLQAADILAHQTNKDVQQKILGYDSTRHFKRLFYPQNLPTPVAYNSEFYDAGALDKLLESYRREKP
jgi:hypothetical protein